MFKPCIIIPVYEHAEPLKAVLATLLAKGYACVLVDDGSGPACKEALQAMAAAGGGQVSLIRLEKNRGKGAAVKAGLRFALDHGFTHGAQVDADGQHDLAAVDRLIEAARLEPLAVVGGQPVFDASAPGMRFYGRRLTNFWVHVNTLSRAIPDSMCGLRVYPLADTLAVIDHCFCGDRMDFDTEILVRLHWAGLPLRFMPVAVHYPEGGSSHFRMGMDNVLISFMHTRLFFGMLLRFPYLLWRKRA